MTQPNLRKIKILFIAYAHSTHTMNWIDLLDDAPFEIRVFGVPSPYLPPKDWNKFTYISFEGKTVNEEEFNPKTRLRLYSVPSKYLLMRVWQKTKRKILTTLNSYPAPEKWLMKIIKEWQPDVIETMGIDPAAKLYYDARHHCQLDSAGKWLLTLRGGPDTELRKNDPQEKEAFSNIIKVADFIISDNELSINTVKQLGATEKQIPSIYNFPGAGGVDVNRLSEEIQQRQTSGRRLVFWAKGYDTFYAVVLPTLEALRTSWDKLQPCEVIIAATSPIVRQWYWTLPEYMRWHIQLKGYVSYKEFMGDMQKARVLLAPSLLDGTPHALLEAMACGAFPIVSPLETLTSIVKDEENVLFARNLYPQEIADALVRAMNDDDLVDSAAQNNLELVRRIANRPDVRRKAIELYTRIAAEN